MDDKNHLSRELGSERASERMTAVERASAVEQAVRNKQMSVWTSECPRTLGVYFCFFLNHTCQLLV